MTYSTGPSLLLSGLPFSYVGVTYEVRLKFFYDMKEL